ncbi:hypothetical protein DEU56DRAFT_919586 [Suillus clintonianus]|uniref:uncharacterized protein n=1 Tax=Suillus clintonianus TaxID=1904413 RepID=UPI001B866696|nr:uncharacterized protein DEU56DRAFT_919586 [Suillus clintonianus]KAG2114424.1 hypothetical protein DEU56DRAFT_919586 [Suillus clintonianus]
MFSVHVSHMKPPSTMKITEYRDIAAMILDLLVITDLTAISRTCQIMRELGQEVIRRRFRHILEPFAGNHLPSFLSALRHGNGLITGSSVRAMMGYNNSSASRDLNILVPYTGFDNLHETIEHTLGFTSISRVAHPAIAASIGIFRKYKSKHRIITLSASHKDQNILHIILNAPTTADMLFMTTGGLCYFYPNFYHAGIAIESHSGNLVPNDKKLGCAGEITDEFEMEKDMSFLNRTCNDLCPTFWHHVEEKRWRLCVDWNVEDSVTKVFHDINVEWRLNRECTNSECPRCFTEMSQNCECAGASNRDDVKWIPRQIRYRKPPFLQLIKGIFYGAQCHRPFLVPIPVKDGIDKPPTLDDLDINYWDLCHYSWL